MIGLYPPFLCNWLDKNSGLHCWRPCSTLSWQALWCVVSCLHPSPSTHLMSFVCRALPLQYLQNGFIINEFTSGQLNASCQSQFHHKVLRDFSNSRTGVKFQVSDSAAQDLKTLPNCMLIGVSLILRGMNVCSEVAEALLPGPLCDPGQRNLVQPGLQAQP